MASLSLTNDSEIQAKQDEIIIPKSEILDEIIMGELELFPGLERASLSLHENGLIFRLGDRMSKRSKSFSTKREMHKAESTKDQFRGAVEFIPQKCIVIKWEDFLNCRNVNAGNKQQTNLLEIISYEVFALTKKFKCKKRSRSVLRFSPLSQTNVDSTIQLWIDKILLASRKYVQRHYKSAKLLSDKELLAKKRVLVLLNPVSGKGKALQTFHRQIGSFLNEAGINFELFVSERAGHVRDMLRQSSLDEWDAFLFVSGDGLLNEGINGLLSREDADIAIRKPIGILPCGSGNAIAGLILYYSREFFSPLNAAFVFAKGLYNSFQSLDIGIFNQGGNTSYFSLAIAWGIGADVDIESEVFRKLGDLRFTLGFLWRVLKRRVYQAELSYIPYDDSTVSNDPPQGGKRISGNENITVPPPEKNPDPSWIQVAGPFTNVCLVLTPMISHDLFIAPGHDFGEGFFTLSILPYENVTRRNLFRLFDSMAEDNLNGLESVSYIKVKAFRILPNVPENGYLVVDGEVAQYVECSAEMSKYKLSMPSLFNRDAT